MRSAPLGYYPFYLILEIDGKDPLSEISWKKKGKTVEEAYKFLEFGYNVGIAAMEHDPLVLIDVDDPEQVPDLKPTLQVFSSKQIGNHNYYFTKDPIAKRNISTEDAGEVRASGEYVVAPGSFVTRSKKEISMIPDKRKQFAGQYMLANDLSVAEITFVEFPEVYKIRQAEMKQEELNSTILEIERKTTNQNKKRDGKYKSALWDLDITEVSGVRDIGGKRVAMPVGIHSTPSKTEHNCSVKDGLLTCWRHYMTHTPFTYLAILAGVSSCERSGKPHKGRFFGVDSQDGYTVFKVWKYAKSAGLISQDDPIPLVALSYYATQKGLCKKGDLIDGYRLPNITYTIALLMGKKEGLNFGRQ